jgi:GDP-4-dehydro-6-deoxy-D-mannose reductase
MRALVTGACGFVGPHLTQHLTACGDVVAGAYRDARKGVPQNSYILDLMDRTAVEAMVREFQPEVVYHLAGMSFVPEADSNFTRALDLNVALTELLLSVCSTFAPNTKFVYVSSGEVYGKITGSDLPLKEEQKVCPQNNYSLTKAMAEMVITKYQRKIKTVILRSFNHIGPGQDSRFVTSSFAKQLAAIFLGKQEPLLKVGNLDAKRDFTDVRDIVRGYRLAAEHGTGVFNLCHGKAISISEVLNMLISVSGLTVKLAEDPTRLRPSENPDVHGSFAKAQKELGWHPLIGLEESLKSVYTYWLSEVSRLS